MPGTSSHWGWESERVGGTWRWEGRGMGEVGCVCSDHIVSPMASLISGLLEPELFSRTLRHVDTSWETGVLQNRFWTPDFRIEKVL